MPVRVGPGAAKLFATMGYPGTADDNAVAKAFWQQIAISRNARTISAPILAWVYDDEMWGALQSFTALREQRCPIDLYIFPDEHHVKWQPAHRLAVYTRSIDWFDYWLSGASVPRYLSGVCERHLGPVWAIAFRFVRHVDVTPVFSSSWS